MRRWALLLTAIVVAGTLAAVLWHLGDQSQQGPGPVTSSGEAAVGGPFVLTDQYGRTRTDTEFSGHFMLIYFGYTNCPDVCPTTLSVIADAMDKLKGAAQQITPVFITVDPARDTPAVLKDYLAAFGPEFVGLTGTQAQIEQVAKEYKVYTRSHSGAGGTYTVDHSNVIYLIGPGGKFVADYDETVGPEKLAADILKQMD